eukprot:30532_1
MACFSLLLVSSLISAALSQSAPITIYADSRTNGGYYSLMFTNIDPSECGATISNVQISVNGASYMNNDQYYWEPSDSKDRYAWIQSVSSSPISVNIVLSTGIEIEMVNIITDLDSTSVFVSDQTICGTTLAPTAPTKAPTTKTPTAPTTAYPTAEAICIGEGSLNWQSYDNELKLNGNRFNMKGLSWFGYETPNNGLYGLDVHS